MDKRVVIVIDGQAREAFLRDLPDAPKASEIGAVTQGDFDAKFNGATGHTHDGTDGSGPPVNGGDADTLDGKHAADLIPESGSNENGYYVKHPDGTLECWGKKTETVISANNYHLFTITFPLPFKDAEYVLLGESTGIVNGKVGFSGRQANPTTTGCQKYLYERDGNTWGANVAATYQWHAVGRWK